MAGKIVGIGESSEIFVAYSKRKFLFFIKYASILGGFPAKLIKVRRHLIRTEIPI